jgi:MYXO-CTERM domain-containing protein
MRTSPGNGDLGYDDLAKLFAATLATDLPAGKTALETAMTGRGVLPSCERIFESTGAPIKAAEPQAGGFAAPGTQSVSFGAIAPGIIQVHAKTADTTQITVTFTSPKASGGTNPLGGNGTPFTPVLLAKFGKPITWTATGGGAHDADKTLDAPGTTTHTAVIDLPAGTTDVYLQVGNKGESDGAYDGFTVTPTGAAPPPANTDPTVTPATTPSSSSSDSGCGCSTPGQTTGGLGGISLSAVAGLAIAAGVVRRRRRS